MASHIPRLSGIRPPSIAGNKQRSRSNSRSSVNSVAQRARSSSIGKISSRTSFASRISDGGRPKKDTRPLSSKEYQQECMQKLSMFLQEYKFERYSTRLLSSPSTQEFFMMFEFIYGLVARNYKPKANKADEVLAIMKYLRYPYNISRSHLLNPGSRQSWHHLLPFLTWIIDLVKYCRNYQIPIRRDKYEEYRCLSDDSAEELDCRKEFAKSSLLELFYQQTSEQFLNYIQRKVDLSEDEKENEIRFLVKEYMGVSEEELEELKDNHFKLEEELKKSEQELVNIKDQERQIVNTRVDIARFTSYNEEMAQRIELKKKELATMNKSNDSLRERLRIAKEKNAKLKETLRVQKDRGINAQVRAAMKKQFYDDLAYWEAELESVINKKMNWELNQLEIHNEFNQHCKALESLRLKLDGLVQENLNIYKSFHDKQSMDKFLTFSNLLEKVSSKEVELLQKPLPDLLGSLKKHFEHEGALLTTAIFHESKIISELEIQSNILDINIRDINSSIAHAQQLNENEKKELENKLEMLLKEITVVRNKMLETDKTDQELVQIEENIKILRERLTVKEAEFEKYEMETIEEGKKRNRYLKKFVQRNKEEKESLVSGLELLHDHLKKLIEKY